MSVVDQSEVGGAAAPRQRRAGRRASLGTYFWLQKAYVLPFRRQLLLALLFSVLSAGSVAALAWLVAPAIDLIDQADDASLLYWISAGVMAAVTVNGLSLYTAALISESVSQKMLAALQKDIFRALIDADYASTSRRHTGKLIAICTADAGRVTRGLTGLLVRLTSDLAIFLFLLAVMFMRDWQVSLAMLLFIPVLGIGMVRITRQVRSNSIKLAQANYALSTLVADVLGALRLVKVANTAGYEFSRHSRAVDRKGALAVQLRRARSASIPLNEIAGGATLATVMLLASIRLGHGDGQSLGELGSLLAAVFLASRPVKRFSLSITEFQQALIAARRIRRMLTARRSIVDAEDAVALGEVRQGLAFRGVRFSYDGEKEILKGIDLDLPKGQMVALVGPSGSGKSTLVNLIPRLYDVTDGAILVDGVDLRALQVASLREAVALVSQDVLLFDGTIRANIAYLKPDASDDEIAAAAQAANAYDFITALPDGFETMVGERGQLLSGGQRQRIALARALLKDAPILILDEPSSSLDPTAEQEIVRALRNVAPSKVVLIVAHRLPMIRSADHIHVLVDGTIVEHGSHDELMRRNGVYSRLFSVQQLEDEIGVVLTS